MLGEFKIRSLLENNLRKEHKISQNKRNNRDLRRHNTMKDTKNCIRTRKYSK